MSDAKPTKDELLAAEIMAERSLVSVLRQAVVDSGLDRQEIARRMGVHKSNVSKILNSPRNLTAKIAGRLLRATGHRLVFSSVPVPERGVCHHDSLVAIGVSPIRMATTTAGPITRQKPATNLETQTAPKVSVGR